MKTYQVTVYPDRTEWKFNGKLHREDGPAIEWANGTKEWYINGKLHREDRPAIEYADGTKEWYINGKRHREDGPAIEYADGTKYWYIKGKQLTEAEFNSLNITTIEPTFIARATKPQKIQTLMEEIRSALNRNSIENGSNTPDFILAEYLTDCLSTFEKSIQSREKWYGRGVEVVVQPPNSESVS